jgi:hypothetical protein
MNTPEINRILKATWFVVVILGAFLAIQTLTSLKGLHDINPAYNAITVTGEGEAFAVPDLATFSFTITQDAKSVTEAQSSVTKKMDVILAGLKGMGIAEKDIKTTDYSVYPKYTYSSLPCAINYCPPSKQIQDGYTANHSVTVKVRKTEDAGKALALAGDKGATGLSSVSFTVDDPDKLTSEARALAIADAKEKAKVLAKDLGVKLVRVVSFSDNTGGGPMPYLRETMSVGMASDQAKAPTLPTGENKVNVSVSVTYEIR